MKNRMWKPGMSAKATSELAYWERNMLALYYADGWYNDDAKDGEPRYDGWRRVLSLRSGNITFHIPDDFEIGSLPQMAPNWTGHTTLEKWAYVGHSRGVVLE